MASNSLKYLQRLLSYPGIRPITDTDWFAPRAKVAGCAHASAFAAPPIGDQEILQPLLADVFAQPTQAFLVLHDGRLIVERYRDYSRQSLSNSMSMMKTVLALLLAIAEADGALDIAAPAAQWLPEWRQDRRREIRLADLLAMQSGLRSDLRWPGRYGLPDILPLYMGTDIARLALSVPAVAAPGAYWEYNNVNSQILGIVLERATGHSFADYLSAKLWQPLACSDAYVYLDRPQGQAHTFTALLAHPHDWLRIAELIRHRGNYAGQQLIPATWFDRMEQPRNSDADYGYHLWLKAHRKRRVRGIPEAEHFFASADFVDPATLYLEGMHQQTIFISRRERLVALRIGAKPDKRRWDSSHVWNGLLRALAHA